jgi:hypothetical protein
MQREGAMLQKSMYLAMVLIPFTAIFVGEASGQASATANVAGQYRCMPLPTACTNSGQNFTVTQTGTNLSVKNERNEIGIGQVTSAISLSLGPPWNMVGLVMPDGHTIQWSNGTEWQKP